MPNPYPHSPFVDFDIQGLWNALDQKREAQNLTERQMCDEINLANNQLHLIPISLATIKNITKRNDTSCHHALHMMRWLNKTPESFLIGSQVDEPLPFGNDGRLYWDMRVITESVTEEKQQREITWGQAAEEIGCKATQLSALPKVRFGISIHLAMKITQWLERPSSDFIVPVFL